jgi:hypothetical protein
LAANELLVGGFMKIMILILGLAGVLVGCSTSNENRGGDSDTEFTQPSAGSGSGVDAPERDYYRTNSY